MGFARRAARHDGRSRAAHGHDRRRARGIRPAADRHRALDAHQTPGEYAPRAPTTLPASRTSSARHSRQARRHCREAVRAALALSAGWAPERRAELLVRYLGFPFWDVLLYPIQAVADVGERDAIEVVRMSPRTRGSCRRPTPPSRSWPGFRPCTSARSSAGPAASGTTLGPAGRRGEADRPPARRGLHRRGADCVVPEGVRGNRRRGRKRPREREAAARPREAVCRRWVEPTGAVRASSPRRRGEARSTCLLTA